MRGCKLHSPGIFPHHERATRIRPCTFVCERVKRDPVSFFFHFLSFSAQRNPNPACGVVSLSPPLVLGVRIVKGLSFLVNFIYLFIIFFVTLFISFDSFLFFFFISFVFFFFFLSFFFIASFFYFFSSSYLQVPLR